MTVINENTWYNIDAQVMKMYRLYCVKKNGLHYRKYFRQNGIAVRKLTGNQKKEVNNLWQGKVKDFSTHEFYYTVIGEFNPRICSEHLFRKELEPRFNNQNLKRAWGDKCYLDRFVPGAPFPHTLLHAVGGGREVNYYDESGQLLNRADAISLLRRRDEFFIKPSIDNGLGKGAMICNGDCDINGLFEKYRADFVIQDVIKPHSIIAKLSRKAVGIVRITTCRINGVSRFLSAALRINEEDVPADNYVTKDGKGMVIIGIDQDGKLKDKGYYSSGVAVEKTVNGEVFGGIEIPSFQKMKETVIEAASKLGHFGFVGWDITIDEKGEPVILEYNIRAPGVLYYQYTSGPLFQEYTDDVIRAYL